MARQVCQRHALRVFRAVCAEAHIRQAVGRCHVRKHDRSDIAKIRIASCGRAASNSGNTAYDQCVAVLRDEPVFQTRTIKGTVARLCEKILARLTFELRMQCAWWPRYDTNTKRRTRLQE